MKGIVVSTTKTIMKTPNFWALLQNETFEEEVANIFQEV